MGTDSRTAQDKQRTVLIVQEPGLACSGLAALCELGGRYRVKMAGDGIEAWRLLQEASPAIVLCDFQVGGMHALELARKLAAGEAQPVPCVLMGSRADRKTVLEVLRAGAQGYLLKSSTREQLYDCLQQVLEGGVYVSPGVDLRSLFAPQGRGEEEEDPLALLSPREYQVFLMLVEGVRAKEVAARLELSPKTVDTYRASLMKKLGIYDIPGLVRLALVRGLLSS
jgi:DNA-binding NarL/FixJ family response regulator